MKFGAQFHYEQPQVVFAFAVDFKPGHSTSTLSRNHDKRAGNSDAMVKEPPELIPMMLHSAVFAIASFIKLVLADIAAEKLLPSSASLPS